MAACGASPVGEIPGQGTVLPQRTQTGVLTRNVAGLLLEASGLVFFWFYTLVCSVLRKMVGRCPCRGGGCRADPVSHPRDEPAVGWEVAAESHLRARTRQTPSGCGSRARCGGTGRGCGVTPRSLQQGLGEAARGGGLLHRAGEIRDSGLFLYLSL